MLTMLMLLIDGLHVALSYPDLLHCNDARIGLGAKMMGIEVTPGDIEPRWYYSVDCW